VVGAPEGGYATAGFGEMEPDWVIRLMRSLQSYRTDRIELVVGPGERGAIDASGGVDVAHNEAWVVDLTGGIERWLANQVDKRVRRQLRICESEGVETTRHGIEGLDEFYDLYKIAVSDNPRRRVYQKAFIGDLLTSDGPGEVALYVTRHRGRPIAAGVLLRGGGDALAWIGCFDRAASHLHGNLHRHFAVIRDLVATGAVTYNLGAAPALPEVARFKRKLGATAIPYSIATWRNPLFTRIRRTIGREQ
jgi:hypothetical protein